MKLKSKKPGFLKEMKKYKCVKGAPSFSEEELRKSPFVIKKTEMAKETLRKYPITLELLGWR